MQDVLLDIEVTLNNRPLGYQEDDIELPTLTPNSLQFVGTTVPELEPHNEEESRPQKTSEISQEVQRSYVEEMEYRVPARFTRETQLETPWEAVNALSR